MNALVSTWEPHFELAFSILFYLQIVHGIRVVTGVQTWDLPIFNWKPCGLLREGAASRRGHKGKRSSRNDEEGRSEERGGGKELRDR